MPELPADRRLLQVLITFASTVVSDYRPAEALEQLLAQIPPVLRVDGAGVMLEDDTGELRFVVASDDVIRKIEAFQIETGEGPCVTAYEERRAVEVPDLSQETPFPRFAEVARDAGMGAVHSFPMQLGTARVGALNLYCASPGALPEEGVELGQMFADVATALLHGARQQDALHEQILGIRRVLEESGAIDQAKGVLMHAYGLEESQAFQALRRHARSGRVRVLEVARLVMAGQLDPADVVKVE
jgi:transcriptional regulator with GAF, ATPase, and Fis domain